MAGALHSTGAMCSMPNFASLNVALLCACLAFSLHRVVYGRSKVTQQCTGSNSGRLGWIYMLAMLGSYALHFVLAGSIVPFIRDVIYIIVRANMSIGTHESLRNPSTLLQCLCK